MFNNKKKILKNINYIINYMNNYLNNNILLIKFK